MNDTERLGALEHLATGAKTTSELHTVDSERLLKLLVEEMPALAWMANLDGWIFWYNRRWYDYTGTTPEDMEGWGWQSVHDPEILPSVMERWQRCILTGDPFEMVFPLRGSDGIMRSFITRVVPVRNAEEEILLWFGTNTEIDELQRTRMALERSEAGYKQTLEATSDAVLAIDRSWRLTYLNPRAEQLYGSSSELMGQNIREVFQELLYTKSPFAAVYERAMYEGIPGKFEAECGDASKRTVATEVYPSKDGLVVFSRDVTKLRHATAAALRNEKLAAVGRLASSVAHEINNPLEAVTNLIYLARNSQTLEEAIPYLESADEELRRASAITNQTLRFHRQATRPTEVSFGKLVKDILVGQHSRLTNSSIRIEQRNRALCTVLCFEGEIRQVLSNLIGNAIDAMQGLGGGTLHIRGQNGTDWRTGQTGMMITVADTGTGMSDLTRVKIFEAFYTSKGIGGTGLGLWISKEIIDRHHGFIKLRTTQRLYSSGTVFRLFLPKSSAVSTQQFTNPPLTSFRKDGLSVPESSLPAPNLA